MTAVLPDFLKVKERILQALNLALQSIVDAHPRLGDMRRVHFFEGDQWDQGAETGSPFHEFSIPFAIDRKAVIDRGPAVFFEQVPALGAAHADLLIQRAQAVFELAAKSGNPNVGRLESTQFTFEEYLELLKRVDIRFDGSGKAVMPTWEPPNREVEERIAAWLLDPILRLRFDAIIDNKREEWRARESDRKLVD